MNTAEKHCLEIQYSWPTNESPLILDITSPYLAGIFRFIRRQKPLNTTAIEKRIESVMPFLLKYSSIKDSIWSQCEESVAREGKYSYHSLSPEYLLRKVHAWGSLPVNVQIEFFEREEQMSHRPSPVSSLAILRDDYPDIIGTGMAFYNANHELQFYYFPSVQR